MNKIFIMLVMLVAGTLCVNAQDYDDLYSSPGNEAKSQAATPSRQSKADESQALEFSDSVAHLRALRGIKKGYWVLLADRVSVGNVANTVFNLNSNANFILVQGSKGMVQVAFNNGEPGLNGLGGVTLEGKVGKVECSTDKDGSTYCSFLITGNEINAHVYISISPNSNRAQADVDMIFSSGRLNIYGTIVPYNQARH